MKIILCLLFTLSLLNACKSGKDKGNELTEIPLHSECLLKNTELFVKWAYKIKVQDSLLCVWDLHGGKRFYHLYSFPQLKFINYC